MVSIAEIFKKRKRQAYVILELSIFHNLEINLLSQISVMIDICI